MKKRISALKKHFEENYFCIFGDMHIYHWVCGGAVRDFFLDRDPKDIDFYFKTPMDRDMARDYLIEKCGFTYTDGWRKHGPEGARGHDTLHKDDKHYDLFYTQPTPLDAINEFDYTVCACAIDSDLKFFRHAEFFNDLKHRRLVRIEPILIEYGSSAIRELTRLSRFINDDYIIDIDNLKIWLARAITIDNCSSQRWVRINNTDGKFCRKPFEHFEIHGTGKVSLCCYSWLPVWAGTVDESTSVKDVFNSDTVKDVRESIHDGSFKYCNAELCPFIQGNLLENREDVKGPRMREIIDEKIVDGLTPDFYNLCYDQSCNLSCPSCRTNRINFNEGPVYDKKIQIQNQIIKEVFGAPHERNCTVSVTGSGDPFGSKIFRELLFSIDGKNFPRVNINLQTNGVMFTERYWNKMEKIHSNINTVIVSLDSACESTYNIVRRGGNWTVLMDNMKFLSALRKQNKINTLRTDFVMQQLNYKEAPGFIKLSKELQVDCACLSKIINWGTFTDEQFNTHAIWKGSHPEHQEFLSMMQKDIMGDDIVSLGNLTEYRKC